MVKYNDVKAILGGLETLSINESALSYLETDEPFKPLTTIKALNTQIPKMDIRTVTTKGINPGRKIPRSVYPIYTGSLRREVEGDPAVVDFHAAAVQPVQLGGTITQHPEKQGFERGVTSAGFPTQEQMTGLGFRQGAASYKPQKYALGEEVIRQEEVPPQQNVEELPQQLAEAPPQSAEGQQMGNIEAAQEQGLSMQPQEIEEPKAKPEEQAADDVAMKVPEGSYVLNYMAVNLAGDDYIIKMLKDARKIAVKQGVNITETESTSKDKVDIRISNGEVIIPPELVAIIGEHQLKLINDKGIAAMKKKEQAEAGQPQEGDYGGQKAYGGFIDMKKGYASGTKVEVEGKKKKSV